MKCWAALEAMSRPGLSPAFADLGDAAAAPPLSLPSYLNVLSPMVFTGRNEVVAKVMFLLVSVILSTGGGGLPQCMLGNHIPREADSSIRSMSGR